MEDIQAGMRIYPWHVTPTYANANISCEQVSIYDSSQMLLCAAGWAHALFMAGWIVENRYLIFIFGWLNN